MSLVERKGGGGAGICSSKSKFNLRGTFKERGIGCLMELLTYDQTKRQLYGICCDFWLS